MKYRIFTAHVSDPINFKHEMDIDLVNTSDHTEVVQEIVDLLNENNFRDCTFKIEETDTEAPENIVGP